jgi:hypothetical protein
MRASRGETATLIWTDREWRGEAHAWIDDQLTRLGRRRTGEVEQPHARPWSTVMLVPTDEGPVWFKAAGSGTGYEVRLLEALAGWESPMILAPLAIDPERAWILLPDAGTRLRDHLNGAAGVDEWLRILPAYASLQRWITPRATDLIALGVPDLRPALMPDRLRALIDDSRTGLGDTDLARMRQLLPVYAEWCHALAAGGIAPTLQHDDLHDGNVFVGAGGDWIVDWGDSVIAHPFATLLATLRSIASRDASLGRADLLRLRDAYLEPWTSDQPRAVLAETVQAVLRVGTVGRALAWQRALNDLAPEAHGDHAGAVGGWLLELFEPTVI